MLLHVGNEGRGPLFLIYSINIYMTSFLMIYVSIFVAAVVVVFIFQLSGASRDLIRELRSL